MNGLISCRTCGLVQQWEGLPRRHQVECGRCGEVLARDRPFSRARTAAFSLAALFLYLSANLYPVMTMNYLGRETENTVWGGVRTLWTDGMQAVAIIVFLASILIPLLKLTGLLFLVLSRSNGRQKGRTRL